MKYHLRLAMALAFLISTGLGACNLPRIDVPSVTVVMDTPHSNGIYPLASIFLGGHASFAAGVSISSFNFYANGLRAGDVPANPDGTSGAYASTF